MSYGNYLNHTVQEAGGDLARPTKFKVILSVPEKLKEDEVKQFSKKLDILAKDFSIPTIKNDIIEVKHKGHSIPVIGRTNFEQTVSITFYLDEPQVLRSILDTWIREIDSKVLGGNKKYFLTAEPQERFGSLTIESLNYDENSATRRFKFENIYPISISGVEFHTDSPSSVSEVTAEFAYSHFKVLKGDFDLSNIFEDLMGSGIDSASDWLFGEGSAEIVKEIRSTTAAVVDIFKGLK